MERPFWHKQTKETPLYSDLLWSRPESRHNAGKLLVIGGNGHGFSAPAEAFSEALKAGVGTVRVVMPDAVKSIAGKIFETIDYAPSTPSGSFAKASLAELIDHASWADGIILPGDLGRNSETAIVIEKLLTTYGQQITLVKDAADYAVTLGENALKRPKTLLVLTIAQLQKLFMVCRRTEHISFDMDLLKLVDVMNSLSIEFPASIMVKHHTNILVASGGQVSSTLFEIDNEDFWRIKIAATAAVWWLQNPSQEFETLTSSVISV